MLPSIWPVLAQWQLKSGCSEYLLKASVILTSPVDPIVGVMTYDRLTIETGIGGAGYGEMGDEKCSWR